jgi:hypothetical protein
MDAPDEAVQHAAPAHHLPPPSSTRPHARDLRPILVKGDLRRFQTPPEAVLPRPDGWAVQAAWLPPAEAASSAAAR